MPSLAYSIIITSLLYVLISYMSYVSAFILHQGITYRLAAPVIKSAAFILLSYISIISDVILFHSALYSVVTTKNGLLLILVTTSLLYAKKGKGT
jgi:hypothetical protein